MGSNDSTARLLTGPSLSDGPWLLQRLDGLEQRCAEMWSDALEPLDERVHEYERLAELDHRIAGLRLRCLAHLDNSALERGADECTRDLERLIQRWTTPHAA